MEGKQERDESFVNSAGVSKPHAPPRTWGAPRNPGEIPGEPNGASPSRYPTGNDHSPSHPPSRVRELALVLTELVNPGPVRQIQRLARR